MRQKISIITQRLQLPVICVLCHQYHKHIHALCKACEALLKPIEHPCQYCSLPLENSTFPICGACIKKPPVFDKVITAYLFEEPLRTLLHDFKYKQAIYLRPLLVKLMKDALKDQVYQPDCLIPVPLHAKRLSQRGFNQAAELAKALAHQLQKPYDLHLCQKILYTPSQVGLSRQKRIQNLKLSFVVKPCSFQHIVLIDDLLTTGSTANELARHFKQHGVKRVDIWCCARTDRPHHV